VASKSKTGPPEKSVNRKTESAFVACSPVTAQSQDRVSAKVPTGPIVVTDEELEFAMKIRRLFFEAAIAIGPAMPSAAVAIVKI